MLRSQHRPIVFIRGFNSLRDEKLRFGPLNFGLVHRYLQPEFVRRDYNFVPLANMGGGSIEHQVESARRQILDLGLGPEIHLLGHSLGGVVARALARALKSYRVLSVATITSPHRGTRLADCAGTFHEDHPFWYKAWKLAGYDVRMRVRLLEPVKTQSMIKFNADHPDLPEVKYASIISGTRLESLPRFLRLTGQYGALNGGLTDGIIEKSSQPWGTVIGDFTADHGGIIGFRTSHSKHDYKRSWSEFIKAVDSLDGFYVSVEES